MLCAIFSFARIPGLAETQERLGRGKGLGAEGWVSHTTSVCLNFPKYELHPPSELNYRG